MGEVERKSAFDSLLNGYTYALQENSDIIVKTLEELTNKPLTEKDKKVLKKIKSSLTKIDKDINKIGG